MIYDRECIERIHRLLRDRRWTQKTLAERAGLHPSSVTRLLAGNSVSVMTGGAVIDALQIKPHTVTYADIPNPKTKKAAREVIQSARKYPRERTK